MIVMGGIVGSGIFINPYVVARQVHTPFLILGAWVFGGLVAYAGAFIYAELAALRPDLDGQYAYLRAGCHPLFGFLYGWTLLLVIQTGALAAVAVTFAHYAVELGGGGGERAVSVLALASLTLVNCFGVRAGSTVQGALMVMKICAVALVAGGGLFLIHASGTGAEPLLDRTPSFDLLTAFGRALTPVLFAYGGWQTGSFMAAEMRRPERDLPRAMLIGVAGVVALYFSINLAYLYGLGASGLAETTTPASALMRVALGGPGASLTAGIIALSTLGFLSQGMLTAPRVYFAMATDGLFFRRVAEVSPRTRVPVLAIVLQGALAIVIALSGRYEQILNYVVSADFIFFGLTGACLFPFRRAAGRAATVRTPLHPATTVFFVAACWLVVLNTFFSYPRNTLIGLAIILAGIPAYFYWQKRNKT